MERVSIPPRRYSKEFREEVARLVTEGGLSAEEASARLSLPKSTLEHWVILFRKTTKRVCFFLDFVCSRP
jgi:transposase-like protein